MSQLGEFLTGVIQRGQQATQDRAALSALAQFSNDQSDQQSDAMVQRGKQAQALRNLAASYAPDQPDLKHQLNAMSVDQLEGVMHGLVMNNAMAQQQSEMGRNQAMADWYRQRVQESAGEGEALSQFANSYLSAGAPATPGASAIAGLPQAPQQLAPGLALSAFVPDAGQTATGAQPAGQPDRVLSAMAEMARVNPRTAGVMMGKILPDLMGQAMAGKAQFFHAGDDPATFGNWQRIPTGPNTSQLVYSDPDAGKLTPQFGDDLNLVGYSQSDARGHSRFVPYKGDATLKAATDPDGNAIPGWLIDSQGRAIDVRSQYQKMMAGSKFDTNAPVAPSAPKAPQAPQPTSVDIDYLKAHPEKAASFDRHFGAGAAEAATAPEFKTAEDVRAAFQAGKLGRPAAKKILSERFGQE